MSNINGLVSIVIPVYRVEDYIKRCIESVMNQTYDDIECIIVDDRGEDKSISICENLIANYHGKKIFKIIRHESNKGVSAARNTGMRNSTGKWLYFIDSDDYLRETAIEHLISKAHHYPSATMIVGLISATGKNNLYESQFSNNVKYIEGNEIGCYLLFKSLIPMNVWDKLYLRSSLDSNQIFFKEGIIHEDHLWIYYALRQFDNIAFADEVTYIHNIRPNSIMTSLTIKRMQDNLNIVLKDILTNLPKYYKKDAILLYLKLFLGYYKRIAATTLSKEVYTLFVNSLEEERCRKVKQLLKLYNLPQLSFTRKLLRSYLYLSINASLYNSK